MSAESAQIDEVSCTVKGQGAFAWHRGGITMHIHIRLRFEEKCILIVIVVVIAIVAVI